MATIKASGGDYSSLSTWEAAQPGTLSAPSEALGDNFESLDNVAIAGIATSAANYLRVAAATGQRHTGIAGTGFRIKDTGGSGTFRVAVNHLRVDGIEIVQTNTAGNTTAVSLNAFDAGSDIRFENCIVHNAVADSSPTINAAAANLNLIWRNNVTYGSCRSWDTRGAASALCENSTFWRFTDQLGLVSDSELTVKNTYVGKASGSADDFWSGGAPTGNNNASSDTSALTRFPTGSINSVAGSAVFTSVTSGSEDFRLKAGTNPLVDAGATLATVTADFIGTARPQGSAYDIGANERAATSTGSTGTVARTNANDTVSGAGTTTIRGTVARTNASDTSTASGKTTITGASARTNANDTASASGSPVARGTAATTNASDTANAAGSLGSSLSGSAGVTNANDTAAATGTTSITGSAARINANDAATASGTTAVLGAAAGTNASDIGTATGTTKIVGTIARSNASDTSSALGATGTISGTSATTNANDTGGSIAPASTLVSGGFPHIGRTQSKKERDAERERLGIVPKQVERVIAKVAKRQTADLSRTQEQAEAELKRELARTDTAYQAFYARLLEDQREQLVQQEIAHLMQKAEDDDDDEAVSILLLM